MYINEQCSPVIDCIMNKQTNSMLILDITLNEVEQKAMMPSIMVALLLIARLWVHVDRKEGEGERERDAAAGARPRQRGQDHNHKEVQRRRHKRDITHPRLQHQVPPVRELQAQRLGHRRPEDNTLLLAQLLRADGWSHMGGRQFGQAEAGGHQGRAALAPKAGEANGRHSVSILQQTGHSGQSHSRRDQGVPGAGHSQHAALGNDWLQCEVRRGIAGWRGLDREGHRQQALHLPLIVNLFVAQNREGHFKFEMCKMVNWAYSNA